MSVCLTACHASLQGSSHTRVPDVFASRCMVMWLFLLGKRSLFFYNVLSKLVSSCLLDFLFSFIIAIICFGEPSLILQAAFRCSFRVPLSPCARGPLFYCSTYFDDGFPILKHHGNSKQRDHLDNDDQCVEDGSIPFA